MDAMEEIRKGVTLLFEEGDIVEVRVPRKHEARYSSTISGFFDNIDSLARAIHYINTKYNQTVYVTMNPLKRDWQAVNNRAYVGSKLLREELEKSGQSMEPRMRKSVDWGTKIAHYVMRMSDDNDVLKRRWILIDVDAGQPAGTNSNHDEHMNTLAMAVEIRQYLIDRGFPAPALTNSGNGHHLYLRVDLPNSPEAMTLVKRFLRSISYKFTGLYGSALVDEGMFNAGRITKATGTLVFKGKESEERPCRRSRVKMIPVSSVPATIAQLESLASEYVPKPGEIFDIGTDSGVENLSTELFRDRVNQLLEFLDFHEIEHGSPKQDDGGVRIPCTCPTAEFHTMDGGELETVAMVWPTGALSFCCAHAHCQQFRSWKSFRDYVESKKSERFNWDTVPLYFGGKRIN